MSAPDTAARAVAFARPGALIVAVVIGAIAWSLISKGLNDIKASNLSMKRTTRSVSQDAQVVKESF